MPEMNTNPVLPSEEIERTADVVSAYVANNVVPPSELPNLIATVHAALASLAVTTPPVEKPTPAISIKRSVQRDNIACLDCGRPFKSLRRHLAANHDLTPEEYRARWDLPADYPMVAQEYAEKRSTLAKTLGLGRANKGRHKKARGRK